MENKEITWKNLGHGLNSSKAFLGNTPKFISKECNFINFIKAFDI